MKTITSRRNPIVKRYREAEESGGADIVLDGVHLIREAAGAAVAVHTIALSARGQNLPEARDLIEQLRTTGTECWSVTDEVMRALSPVRSPSGVVALAARPAVSLEQALQKAPQLVVVAVDVQDPGNVGAIVRAAEAGGATASLFTGASADPFGWKALRGSMGSSFRLTVARTETEHALAALRARGVRSIATTPRARRSVFELDLRRPVAFLVGGEGAGLADAIVDAADEAARIPMRDPVESLNVAVASALLVYEASRQRTGSW